MKRSVACALVIGVLMVGMARAQNQPAPPPSAADVQMNKEGQFCATLYTDTLIRTVPTDEIKRRLSTFYPDPAARNELVSHCFIFNYGVDEAKFMLQGLPYSAPEGQNSKDPHTRRTSMSALRCHQMIQYSLLYQQPTSDQDFMNSLGLSQQEKDRLTRDCQFYALGFRLGDGLLAMGVIK